MLLKMVRSDMSYLCTSAAASQQREHLGHWTSPTIDHLKICTAWKFKDYDEQIDVSNFGRFFLQIL